MSIPRDLWVEYGAMCTVGFQGKINAAYFCGSNEGQDEKAGAKAMLAQAEKITGLDIHYYVHLNFTAVVQAVDAVGGVDVKIETSDPRGILDRNFDWKCNYTCHYVNYKNGEVAHLNGEKALALARARNASGGYGLPGGNFDREKNQQKIVKALREKALSAGTLTNLGAVTGLIDALGQNLRTNIETKELRTLMDFGQKVSNDNIISLSLVEEGNQLVTTGMHNGQSIVRPIPGLLDYSAIKEYVQKSVTAEPFVREEPHVSVVNGSKTAGAAQIEADKLEDLGFVIDTVGNAPEGTYGRIEIYQIDTGKTKTAAKLQDFYGVTVKTTAPPVSVVGETDFLIIVGSVE
jgi:LCP family protein required for cell wall assembly